MARVVRGILVLLSVFQCVFDKESFADYSDVPSSLDEADEVNMISDVASLDPGTETRGW